MSAPGLRLTYQATDTITADAFIQQFRPTVLTNINTPYNVIPSAFFLRDRYYQDNMDEKLNYGIRFKGEFGQYTAQAMYTRRYNQLGAIRWTASQVEKGLPDSNVLGLAFGRYCGLVYGDPGCAKTLSNTAFEVHPAGVFSAEEWFFDATYIRLDGYDATNAVIEEHLSGEDPNFINPNGPSAAQMLFAQTLGHNVEATYNLLSWFGAGARVDHVRQDSDVNAKSFNTYTGRLLFHTNWLSRDEIALQYSHFAYGKQVTVSRGYPPVEDPSLNPDRHVLSLSVSFWW